MIEVAHERAIVRVPEWIEDEIAVIRYGKDGIYQARPPGGLVAARFRHYEARSGMPLLHDHLLLSVKGQRLHGTRGSIHTTALPREHGGRLRAVQRARGRRGLRGAGADDRAAHRHPGAPR
ncbi:relaxase domain-containing protein [Streptomyces microflavus]|uniref:relaxase domain-containing protein n=1 Tax=Streptomyces microflavus TaxID=1919 RepID=UPI0033222343